MGSFGIILLWWIILLSFLDAEELLNWLQEIVILLFCCLLRQLERASELAPLARRSWIRHRVRIEFALFLYDVDQHDFLLHIIQIIFDHLSYQFLGLSAVPEADRLAVFLAKRVILNRPLPLRLFGRATVAPDFSCRKFVISIGERVYRVSLSLVGIKGVVVKENRVIFGWNLLLGNLNRQTRVNQTVRIVMQIHVGVTTDISWILTVVIREFRIFPCQSWDASEVVCVQKFSPGCVWKSAEVVKSASGFVVIKFDRSLSLGFEFQPFWVFFKFFCLRFKRGWEVWIIQLLIMRSRMQHLVALVEGPYPEMTMLCWATTCLMTVRMWVDDKVGLLIPNMALVVRAWLASLSFTRHSNWKCRIHHLMLQSMILDAKRMTHSQRSSLAELMRLAWFFLFFSFLISFVLIMSRLVDWIQFFCDIAQSTF